MPGTAEQIFGGAPHGTGLDGLAQVGVDAGQLALEPAEVLLQAAPDLRCPGEAQPVVLGSQHLQELAPPREQGAQRLGGRRGQGARLGADPLGKEGQQRGIDPVGLGELPGGFAEIVDLAGIGHHDREARGGEGHDHGVLKATGGLEDDEGRGRGADPSHQGGHGRRVIGDLPRLARRADGEVQRGFTDVDTDEDGAGNHGSLRRGTSR